jgi:hypothetical protein
MKKATQIIDTGKSFANSSHSTSKRDQLIKDEQHELFILSILPLFNSNKTSQNSQVVVLK